MKLKNINEKKFKRASAFFLAGTFASCIIINAKNDIFFDISNEFTKGIYYDEDVKRNWKTFYERVNSCFNDRGKVLEKSNFQATRISKK